jgi:hypothetical protein
MTDLAERGSLGVRELQPPLQLGLQDAIFGGQSPLRRTIAMRLHRLTPEHARR